MQHGNLKVENIFAVEFKEGVQISLSLFYNY